MTSNLDPYNRKITYLRISVTDRCNLRCVYCAPVRDVKLLEHRQILTYEEILKIVRIAVDIGVRKLRLTGGEPLVRRNLSSLVRAVSGVDGIDDISITTNGVFLKEMARPLFDAGLRRVNVSLDTLNPLKHRKITGRDCFDAVCNGLKEAEKVGFSPIKINVVAARGLNDDDLLNLARLSIEKPYHIRFIEYMPIGQDNYWRPDRHISSDEIRSRLEVLGPLRRIAPSANDGPAERYRLRSAMGEIGFISPISHHFCPSCNRLRLTADGMLRPCLFADNEVDIKTPLRGGSGYQDLVEVFQRAIAGKPRQYSPDIRRQAGPVRPMSSIGG